MIEAGGDSRGQLLSTSPNLSVPWKAWQGRLLAHMMHHNRDVELTLSGLYDWKWPTVPQAVGGKAQTMSGLVDLLVSQDAGLTVGKYRGKILGGSSSINGMEWSRGSKEQYDAIAALGNPGWGWTDLQRYVTTTLDGVEFLNTSFTSFMKKAERFSPPDAVDASRGAGFDAPSRGFNGLVGIGWPTPVRLEVILCLT